MYDTYIIETRRGAAGIVVRDGSRFRFFAATHDFNQLEGHIFRTPREAEAAANRHIGSIKKPTRSAHRDAVAPQCSRRSRVSSQIP